MGWNRVFLFNVTGLRPATFNRSTKCFFLRLRKFLRLFCVILLMILTFGKIKVEGPKKKQNIIWDKTTRTQGTRSRDTRCKHSIDTILSVQNKDFTRDGKEFTEVYQVVRKPESHLYRQLFGIWQILWRIIMESSYIICHRSETNDTSERVVRRIKEGTYTVLLLLTWMKYVDLILYNITVICEIIMTSCQMGKHFMNDDLENHFKDQWFRLNRWQNIILHLTKDLQDFIIFDEKELSAIFLGYVLYAGGIWKGIFWSQLLRSMKFFDVSEIHARRLNAKGDYKRRKMEKKKNSCFQSQMGQLSCLEKIRTSQNPPCYEIYPKETNSSERIFEESQTDLSRQTQWWMTEKSETIFDRPKKIIFIVITSKLTFSVTCRTKNHCHYHYDTLTWLGEVIRFWMFRKKVE